MALILFVWTGPRDLELGAKLVRTCGFAGGVFSIGVAGMVASGLALGRWLFEASPTKCPHCGQTMFEAAVRCSECGTDRRGVVP